MSDALSFETPRIEPIKSVPWEGEHEFAGNCAVGNMRHGLLATMKAALKSDRVHAETLLALTGMMAGFSASFAAWSEDNTGRSMKVGRGQDGRVYAFGETIEKYIVRKQEGVATFWMYAAAGPSNAGVPPARVTELPYREITQHVINTVGGPDFGKIRVPEPHQVGFKVLDTLPIWEAVRANLGRSDHVGYNGKPLPARFWPSVLGLVTQQYIGMTKDVLDPLLGFQIALESAVAASAVVVPAPANP
jgi:hypothetical protein